jgi:DNA mismatch repair protein MSH5
MIKKVLTGYRFVNADTVCALQIFEDESHPNFHMQGPRGRGKEGLSLFGKWSLGSRLSYP